ncbi:MAG: CPBP family intramembrane metalloprotease [Bacteroidales bacterium]|nr:CPBP family intramembrane metalloprotease [Bacteroidales bacterium]
MKRTEKLTLLLIPLTFATYIVLSKLFLAELYQSLLAWLAQAEAAYFLAYALIGLPMVIAIGVIQRGQFAESVGFNRNLPKGLGLAFLMALPMLIGYAMFFTFNHEITWQKIVRGAVLAGFFEEVYFRVFFFGLMFRYTRLGFFPALLAGALIFASLHLYQSNDPAVMSGIFLTTLLGAGFFAWLYVEWDYNVWLIVGLHLFMNLFWMLFDAGENALGGTLANVFRVITIAVAIGGTLIYKFKLKRPVSVNRRTLWLKQTGRNEL